MHNEFASTSEAFRKARTRASVARAIEATALHTAIYDAREAGLSIRETASALQVPKSTVARHWRTGHNCPTVVPTWGNQDEWQAAHAAVWSHDPSKVADSHLPWEWRHHTDGSFAVRNVPRPNGSARLRTSD